MGVVALQGVEIGEDFAVQGRCDGDEVTDNPSARLRHRVAQKASGRRGATVHLAGISALKASCCRITGNTV